jgi:uncharacterized beta-barrel protein YwiB (DUF1934 family)
MYWLAEEEFAHTVTLVWERTSRSVSGDTQAEADTETERVAVSDAVWRQKGDTHYLTFVDPASGDGGATGKTVLRLQPGALVLTRFGDVTWNHTFEPGQTRQSTMRMGGFWLDVEAKTHELDVHVEPSGGRISLSYRMDVGGVTQEVHLQLQFREGATGDDRTHA